jgi:L-serine/L-threonine ammonia-lyase
MLGMAVTVVVPKSTKEMMRARIRDEGAEVLEKGQEWDDSHAWAVELARESEAAYVHPFDDPVLWSGHATLVEEAREQTRRPSAVVAAVGGGGLLCGVLHGMRRADWNDVPVVAVETEGAASFAASLARGRLVTLESIDSIATSLGARTVADKTLEWARRRPVRTWTVSDARAVAGCFRFLDDHRLLVEPACGAVLAAVYDRADVLAGPGPVLVIVCGGAGVRRDMLEKWAGKSEENARDS